METSKKVERVKTCAKTYKRVFSTADGQKVLQDLMRGHGFVKSAFSKDPYEHAFLAGQRAVVERIIALLQMDFEELDKRMQQAVKKDPFWSDTQD